MLMVVVFVLMIARMVFLNLKIVVTMRGKNTQLIEMVVMRKNGIRQKNDVCNYHKNV
jgi:hypothetical protein